MIRLVSLCNDLLAYTVCVYVCAEVRTEQAQGRVEHGKDQTEQVSLNTYCTFLVGHTHTYTGCRA